MLTLPAVRKIKIVLYCKPLCIESKYIDSTYDNKITPRECYFILCKQYKFENVIQIGLYDWNFMTRGLNINEKVQNK